MPGKHLALEMSKKSVLTGVWSTQKRWSVLNVKVPRQLQVDPNSKFTLVCFFSFTIGIRFLGKTIHTKVMFE
jgi:hypothetical protein